MTGILQGKKRQFKNFNKVQLRFAGVSIVLANKL